jgi:5'-3' exonuclease
MEIFPEYKKKRKTLTQEEEQSRVIKTVQFNQIYDDVLPSLGFRNIYRIRGYESDDLIACIVKGRNPKETIVVSSDHDLFQLLDNCSLYAPTKKQSTDKNIFMREHGIEPSLWHQVKAIAGCNTDEVPGIPSVGEKSAVKYLKGQLKGIKLKDIEAKPEIIKRNLPLVTLPFAGCPVPRLVKNELTIDGFKEVCEKYGMGSLLERDAIRIWERLIRWMS